MKKFYKVILCRVTMTEYDSDKYSNKSIDYYRYGKDEKEVILKLRREFGINMRSKAIERDSTNSPYIQKDFDGKIFLTYDTSNDDESIYYEWYIKEDTRTNNIKKITILDDLND